MTSSLAVVVLVCSSFLFLGGVGDTLWFFEMGVGRMAIIKVIRRLWKITNVVLFCALLLLLAGKVGLLQWMVASPLGEEARVSTVSVRNMVRQQLPVGEYVSLSCPCETVYEHTDTVSVLKVLPSTRRTVLLVEGVVKLGFDFQEVAVEEEVAGGVTNIVLYMPAIKVLSHEVAVRTQQEHNGVFNKYDKDARDEIRRLAQRAQAGEVTGDVKLLAEARASADQYVGLFLSGLPGVSGRYGICFRWRGDGGEGNIISNK